jgi:hypothetical protein
MLLCALAWLLSLVMNLIPLLCALRPYVACVAVFVLRYLRCSLGCRAELST